MLLKPPINSHTKYGVDVHASGKDSTPKIKLGILPMSSFKHFLFIPSVHNIDLVVYLSDSPTHTYVRAIFGNIDFNTILPLRWHYEPIKYLQQFLGNPIVPIQLI